MRDVEEGEEECDGNGGYYEEWNDAREEVRVEAAVGEEVGYAVEWVDEGLAGEWWCKGHNWGRLVINVYGRVLRLLRWWRTIIVVWS